MGTKGQRGGNQNKGCRWTWYAEEKQRIAKVLGFSDPITAMCEMYAEWGFSTVEIGACFGMHRQAIGYRLKKQGITIRPRGGPYRPGKYNPLFVQTYGIAKEFLH